jgi:hypothetical protein
VRPVRLRRPRRCAARGFRRFVLESVSARADGALRSPLEPRVPARAGRRVAVRPRAIVDAGGAAAARTAPPDPLPPVFSLLDGVKLINAIRCFKAIAGVTFSPSVYTLEEPATPCAFGAAISTQRAARSAGRGKQGFARRSAWLSLFGGKATRASGVVPVVSDEVLRFRGEGVGPRCRCPPVWGLRLASTSRISPLRDLGRAWRVVRKLSLSRPLPQSQRGDRS